jgi:hypothetical protein
MHDQFSSQTEHDAPKKKTSLNDFVGLHQPLITSTGVFIALTIFCFSITNQNVGFILSFFFMAISLLFLYDLVKCFKKDVSLRLGLFQLLLNFAMFALLFYWLYEYREIILNLLIIVVFGVVGSLYFLIIRKTNILNLRFWHKNIFTKILLGTFYLVSVSFIFLVSGLITTNIKPILSIILESLDHLLKHYI